VILMPRDHPVGLSFRHAALSGGVCGIDGGGVHLFVPSAMPHRGHSADSGDHNPPRVPTTALQVESITSLRWGACLFDTRMPWLCVGAAVCTSPRAWGMPVGSPGPRDLLRTLRARASRPQNRHTALRETSRCGFLGVS
jgi:hypothetical protein